MFIPIDINENSSEPLYAQITNQLRALILSGYLDEGMLLPSIRELSHQLRCSVITVRRVYQDLEGEGLLRTKQGTGTFVAPVGIGEREQYRKRAVEEALVAAIEAAMRVEMSAAELAHMLEDLIRQKKMK
ncbi:GntR family transcriptional regulator [Paenibacillus melissococcoides]|uniref:GntR family transcriptional regulator n=1 Tax=Paenibacillus melissococcoides TaxID=2912268 RepID=A0ABM9G021_9BACL|nr:MULTISPECIES: GntR family transcriptional regulator [Paenibacillus]MEB9894938.1 GntR family transcriptional regulator [Bacillus cereus]CAH8244901.1 GntR family transcriptional regulator [Paenibacillus melissococcoides]CAH8709312.1 GntR family transcriptional regulator [Paenibacillus melissococcoides]CAH8710043.1 GntR family transcriptional regulator [Paenibacillus melissococcoides]GIO79877.1 GntR family transcriptional regulator [Paenibacillus dendritiformis]